MTALEVRVDSAAEFVAATLGYARAAAMPEIELSLPHLRVRLRADDPVIFERARFSLVDDPAFAGSAQAALAATFLDRSRRRDLEPAYWSGATGAYLEPVRALDAIGVDGLYDNTNDLWRLYDRDSREGIELLGGADRVAPWDVSFPLRDLLHWALAGAGARLVHAGTLGIGGKGALVIGPGGSGKSGTTLAGVTRGLDSVGDDYVALSMPAGVLEARPLLKVMKQDLAGLRRAGLDPVALGLGPPNWQDKYEFDFAAIGRGRRAHMLAIGCILLPRIAGRQRSAFTRTSAREAMLHLVPNNLYQLPGGWHGSFGFIAAAVRSVPSYRLDLSSDADEIADAIGTFIAGLP